MHITHRGPLYEVGTSFDDYYDNIKLFAKDREVRCNGIVHPDDELKDPTEFAKAHDFLVEELNKHPQNVGEVLVFPSDTIDDIEARLLHPNIKGLKCYCFYAECENKYDATIGEYLPESAWEVANQRKMVITLHMVKNECLAHPDNLNYIIKMAKKYPDAVLILAHAARAFAAWTVFGTVDKLVDLENVWFDFSAICETPAMLYIIKKVGVSRCMWGTDYPVAAYLGKPISLGNTFTWLNAGNFSGGFPLRHVITEGFMAMRELSILADFGKNQLEDIFYNNASRLFDVK